MKNVLAKTQEKTTVMHMKDPNLAKKTRMQRKSGTDASTVVAIPERTVMPISPRAAATRSPRLAALECM
jgi:hypothetical protein